MHRLNWMLSLCTAMLVTNCVFAGTAYEDTRTNNLQDGMIGPMLPHDKAFYRFQRVDAVELTSINDNARTLMQTVTSVYDVDVNANNNEEKDILSYNLHVSLREREIETLVGNQLADPDVSKYEEGVRVVHATVTLDLDGTIRNIEVVKDNSLPSIQATAVISDVLKLACIPRFALDEENNIPTQSPLLSSLQLGDNAGAVGATIGKVEREKLSGTHELRIKSGDGNIEVKVVYSIGRMLYVESARAQHVVDKGENGPSAINTISITKISDASD